MWSDVEHSEAEAMEAASMESELMNDMEAEPMVAGVKTGVSFKDTPLSKGGRSDENTTLAGIAE